MTMLICFIVVHSAVCVCVCVCDSCVIYVVIIVTFLLVVTRGGFKEWPLGQWLMRPSRNEKRRPFD